MNVVEASEDEERDCYVSMNNWHSIAARSVKIRKCWFKRVNCHLEIEKVREREEEKEERQPEKKWVWEREIDRRRKRERGRQRE